MSDHSPGLINGREVLMRVVVTPIHMHRKRKDEVTAACLSQAETSGLSLLRREHASNDEVIEVATRLVENARQSHGDKAGVFGVLEMQAAMVRGFIADREADRSYCLYDTAEPTRPSHSEAFQRVNGVAEEVRLLRRTGLFNLIKGQFVPVTAFRDGLLRHLAPKIL
jgi:hypothetical protein